MTTAMSPKPRSKVDPPTLWSRRSAGALALVAALTAGCADSLYSDTPCGDEPACAAEELCLTEAQGANYCGPPLAAGAPCFAAGDCGSAADCTQGVCVSKVGVPCAQNGDCAAGLSCIPAGDSDVCALPSTSCGPCDDSSDCATGSCAGGTCVAAEGASCTPGATDCCEAGLLCYESQGAGTEPQCAPPQSVPGAFCPGANPYCAEPMICAGASCLLPVDVACSDDSQCLTGSCLGSTCTIAQIQAGTPCDSPADCAAGLICVAGVCLGDVGAPCGGSDLECADPNICLDAPGACGPPLEDQAPCADANGAPSDDCAAGLTCYSASLLCQPLHQGQSGAPCISTAECDVSVNLACDPMLGLCLLPGVTLSAVKTQTYPLTAVANDWDDNPTVCSPLPVVDVPPGYQVGYYVHSMSNGRFGVDQCEDLVRGLAWLDEANGQVCARVAGVEDSVPVLGCNCNCNANDFSFNVTAFSYNPTKFRFVRTPLSSESGCVRPTGYPDTAPCLSLAEHYAVVDTRPSETDLAWDTFPAVETLGGFDGNLTNGHGTSVVSYREVLPDPVSGFDTEEYVVFASFRECDEGMVAKNGLLFQFRHGLQPAITNNFLRVPDSLGSFGLSHPFAYGSQSPALLVSQVRSYELLAAEHPSPNFFQDCGVLLYQDLGEAKPCTTDAGTDFPYEPQIVGAVDQGVSQLCETLFHGSDYCGYAGDVVSWAAGELGELLFSGYNGCAEGADKDTSYSVLTNVDESGFAVDIDVRNGNGNSRLDVAVLSIQFAPGL